MHPSSWQSSPRKESFIYIKASLHKFVVLLWITRKGWGKICKFSPSKIRVNYWGSCLLKLMRYLEPSNSQREREEGKWRMAAKGILFDGHRVLGVGGSDGHTLWMYLMIQMKPTVHFRCKTEDLGAVASSRIWEVEAEDWEPEGEPEDKPCSKALPQNQSAKLYALYILHN